MVVDKRYSTQELEEFKLILLQMKSNDEVELNRLEEDLIEFSENGKEENTLDSTTYTMQVEAMMKTKSRHLRHLRMVENALLRIENKHYGICAETGVLISKDRLMAIPTTSLSMEGKNIRDKKSKRI